MSRAIILWYNNDMPLTNEQKIATNKLNAINKKMERLLKNLDLLLTQLEDDKKSVTKIEETRANLSNI